VTEKFLAQTQITRSLVKGITTMKVKTLSLVAGMTLVASVGFAQSVIAQDGMTWTKTGVDDIYGVVDVGCGHTPTSTGGFNQCDPYNGDTDCDALLPVLCFLPAGLPKPHNLSTPSHYHQWSGGVVATTPIVSGNSFATVGEVDDFCRKHFGSGWRVAEFHDGWGWYFKAYGNVGNNFNYSRRRFWVHINGQANGNCW